MPEFTPRPVPMPEVSIIIPCYNEEATIRLLLEALYAQTYPRAAMEVVIADGLSNDQTRSRIAAFQSEHPDLHVSIVDNPRRNIPAGLNVALHAAAGEWIVRLDGHSQPAPDYVARCVEALQSGKGDNVGGIWLIQPGARGWLAEAIAIAAAHPLGVGDARYRVGGAAQKVDTVPFGAYRRALAERIGYYDESLLTNEDYEFNVRVRLSGGVVWMDPQIRSNYFARPSLTALARQYWRYGYWKARMLRRYPQTLRWRQFLPPAFVLLLTLLAALSLFLPLARWLFGALLSLYLGVVLFAGAGAALTRRRLAFALGLPLAIAVMHFAWGAGFLWSILLNGRTQTRP